MKKTLRSMVVVPASGGLILAGTGVASAAVSKSGTKNCPGSTTPQSYLLSRTSGSSVGYAPGGVNFSHSDGVTTNHKDYGTLGGGGWKVTVTGGIIDDAGTYAGCERA
ncbi:hypothetical protein [Nakamurella lactea]|uniref:hypothetical protein n=1 Tax=Nakamurella lactea TaxID=459515 RepID=UPI0004098628|nr:hypothetical protein [Nakamurella lactea]